MEPTEDLYLEWLASKVRRVPAPQFDELFLLLHSYEFVWPVAEDSNCSEHGKEQRKLFYEVSGLEILDPREGAGCSVLEMLVSLAERAEFQTTLDVPDWFWIFMENLGLDDFRMAQSPSEEEMIDEILFNFVWRNYSYDGEGGLFPIRQPKCDQRVQGIWYQFHEYLGMGDVDPM